MSAGLRCLFCLEQSIDDSEAPLAGTCDFIRDEPEAGETDAQVMTSSSSGYGDFVLRGRVSRPRPRLLWASPFAVLFIAALFLFRRKKTAAANEAPLSAEERAALDRALQ